MEILALIVVISIVVLAFYIVYKFILNPVESLNKEYIPPNWPSKIQTPLYKTEEITTTQTVEVTPTKAKKIRKKSTKSTKNSSTKKSDTSSADVDVIATPFGGYELTPNNTAFGGLFNTFNLETQNNDTNSCSSSSDFDSSKNDFSCSSPVESYDSGSSYSSDSGSSYSGD